MRAPSKDKGNRTSQYRDFAKGWQPVGFVLCQIHRQHDRGRGERVGAKKSNPARLDHAP